MFFFTFQYEQMNHSNYEESLTIPLIAITGLIANVKENFTKIKAKVKRLI